MDSDKSLGLDGLNPTFRKNKIKLEPLWFRHFYSNNVLA